MREPQQVSEPQGGMRLPDLASMPEQHAPLTNVMGATNVMGVTSVDDLPEAERSWTPTHLVAFDSQRLEDSFDRPLVAYDYAYVRLVPRVDTGEFINVGVILYCRTRRYLGARITCTSAQLIAAAPNLDPATVTQHLALIPSMCNGEGPIGALGQAEVFHWLVAPHSTVIQSSEVHSGLCADPEEQLERLAERLRARG